jgi:hypothetical protein
MLDPVIGLIRTDELGKVRLGLGLGLGRVGLVRLGC